MQILLELYMFGNLWNINGDDLPAVPGFCLLAWAGVRHPNSGCGRCAERQRSRQGWLQVMASAPPGADTGVPEDGLWGCDEWLTGLQPCLRSPPSPGEGAGLGCPGLRTGSIHLCFGGFHSPSSLSLGKTH